MVLSVLIFALSATVILVVSSFWPPPRELDVAASKWWTAGFSRVAWTAGPLALATAGVLLGTLCVGAIGRVRLVMAFLAAVGPYPLLSIVESALHPDRHDLLFIEWAVHTPLVLLGLASMAGTQLGSSLRRPERREVVRRS